MIPTVQSETSQVDARVEQKAPPLPGGKPGVEFAGEKLNDNHSAVAFVNQHFEFLRYVYTWRKWLFYNGKRWSLAEGNHRAMSLSREYARSLFDIARDMHRSNNPNAAIVAKFATKSNGKERIKAIEELARCDDRVAIDHLLLDKDKFLLNCQNGTIDLRDGSFVPHSPSDLLTQIAGVDYVPGAECPEWCNTMHHVFDGDEDLISYVQTLLGYSLAGITDEHILPICFGDGNNGKSTIWNTWSAIMGDYGGEVSSDLLLPRRDQHPTELADLFGKRYVAVGEPESGSSIAEAKVKELTGEKTIKARRMREDFWSFDCTHTFWLSTNHKPQISGTDEGIWRRVKLIPFTVDLKTVVKIDKSFPEKLKAEYPGILNWALDGWRNYQAAGLVEPQAVIDATSEYREEEDKIGRFIRETYVTNAKFVVGVTEAFEAYEKWGGFLKKLKFSAELAKRYKKVKHTTGKYRNKWVFEGIGLLS